MGHWPRNEKEPHLLTPWEAQVDSDFLIFSYYHADICHIPAISAADNGERSPRGTTPPLYIHKAEGRQERDLVTSEDARLREAVSKYGPRWVLVANEVESRNGDQCAKRWNENLNPELDHRPWTPEEEEQLLSLVSKYGNNWKFIANSFLESRAPLALKNRYSLLMRRLRRQRVMDQTDIHSTSATQVPSDSISSSMTSRNVSPISSSQVGLAGLFSQVDEPNFAVDVADGGFPTIPTTPSNGALAVSTTAVAHCLQAADEGICSRTIAEPDAPDLTWQPGSVLGVDVNIDELPGISDCGWHGNPMGNTSQAPDNASLDRSSPRRGENKAARIEYSVSCQRGKLKSLVSYLVEAALSESADGAMEEEMATLTLHLQS